MQMPGDACQAFGPSSAAARCTQRLQSEALPGQTTRLWYRACRPCTAQDAMLAGRTKAEPCHRGAGERCGSRRRAPWHLLLPLPEGQPPAATPLPWQGVKSQRDALQALHHAPDPRIAAIPAQGCRESAGCSHGVRVVAATVGGGVEHRAGKDVEHHDCGRGDPLKTKRQFYERSLA